MSEAFGFEPCETNPHPDGGLQFLYRFPNGYGASIAPSHYGPYIAEREAAVIRWLSEERGDWDYDWTTPLAEYSIRLNVPYIEEFLNDVAQLPKKERS